MTIVDYNKGHRSRLRERLINSSEGQLRDDEILEMLLCLAQPRKDMKILSRDLIAKFGSFAKVLSADHYELSQITGVGESILASIRLVHEAATRLLKQNIDQKPIFESWDDLLDYFIAMMSHVNIEQFRIAYLDKKGAMIEDELVQSGTIDHVAIYPREIIKKALYLSSSSIILIHNHPSGKVSPSKEDIKLTKSIKEACQVIGINLFDHIIIGNGKYYSFKYNGLI